jgi:aspartate aminotransferase
MNFNIHDFYDELNRLNVKYRLDAGQPDIPVDSRIIDALFDSLSKGETKYVSAGGIVELREMLAEIHGVQVDEVIIGPGSKLLVASQIHNAQSIGIVRPFWPSYFGISRHFNKKTVFFDARFEDKWIPSFTEMRDIDTLILNYPNNPTGIVLEKEILKSIVESAIDHNIKIVSDEVYRDITYNDKYCSILQFNYNNILFIHSFSKTFGMTGFRIAYAIGNKDIIKGIKKYLENTVTCIPMFIQRAAIKALEIKNEVTRYIRSIYLERLTKFRKSIDKSLYRYIVPDGAIYVFLSLDRLNISGVEMAYRLAKAGVGVFPGEAFGIKQPFIRVALTEPHIEAAVERINMIGEEL